MLYTYELNTILYCIGYVVTRGFSVWYKYHFNFFQFLVTQALSPLILPVIITPYTHVFNQNSFPLHMRIMLNLNSKN